MTMKWGDKFGPEYPNLIHRMAKKHIKQEFKSYCMTENPEGLDDEIKPVECTEQWLWQDIVDNDQWYFWDGIKMSLFAPKLCGIEGKILFSDLDNLFLGPMDRIINTPTPAMIDCDWMPPWHVGMHGQNYFLTMLFNASLIYVDNTQPVTNEIWTHFSKNYRRIKQSLYSADAYLWRKWRSKINTYPKGSVYSFNRGAAYPDNYTVRGDAAKYKYRPDHACLLYTSPSPRDPKTSRMPSSA